MHEEVNANAHELPVNAEPGTETNVGGYESNPRSAFERVRSGRVARGLAAATAGLFAWATVADNPEKAKAAENNGEDLIINSEFSGACEDGEAMLSDTIELSEQAEVFTRESVPGEDDRTIRGRLVSTDRSTRTAPWDSHFSSTEDVELYHIADENYRNRDSEDRPLDGSEEGVEKSEVQTVEYPCNRVGGPEYTINTENIAGSTPAETSVLASREHFADGEANTAVLATVIDFADALAGGPLAKAVDGPILFSGRDHLNEMTAEEVQRLDVNEVLILGGEAALSAEVEHRLQELGVNTTRVAGPTRLETAVEIDSHIREHTDASSNEQFIVNAYKFADAMAGAGLAAQEGASIVLTAAGELPETTRRHLEARRHDIEQIAGIGGTAVISSEVLEESAQKAQAESSRLSGRNRYETSEEVAARDYEDHGNEAHDARASIYMAPASNFYGALVAGPLEAQQENAGLLLVPEENGDLLGSFERAVRHNKHTSWLDARIIGNVSPQIQERLDDILDTTEPVDG